MNKQTRGLTIYLNRVSAEEWGKRRFCDDGTKVVRRRWRRKSGEFDLIFLLGSLCVFVEVKRAKDLATAVDRVTRRQLRRIGVRLKSSPRNLRRG